MKFLIGLTALLFTTPASARTVTATELETLPD
jgi:hypothetical protein